MPSTRPDQPDDALHQLARIAESHDSKVRLLFQLQNYISLVKYDPAAAKRDKTAEFRRFVSTKSLDIWDTLNAKSDTRKTFKRLQNTRKEVEVLQQDMRQGQLQQKAAPTKTSSAHGSATHTSRTRQRDRHKDTANASSSRPGASTSTVATAAASARSNRAQRHQSKAQKRKGSDAAVQTQEEPTSGIWKIDSELCWPDQLPSAKRIRPNRLIVSPWHYAKPAFRGNLAQLLSTYKTVSDDHESITSEQWEKRVESDAAAVLRVHYAQKTGLLNELRANGVGCNRQIPKFVPPAPEEPSFYDNMLSHAIQYSKQRSNLRKFHQSVVKRNTQSIEQYFRRLVGAEDREKKELERQLKQIARRAGQEIMKKWKLAQKIVEQRREAALAEEKREQGKVYLNQILDNSAKLIESRIGDGDSKDTNNVENPGKDVLSEDENEDDNDDDDEEDEEDEEESEDENVSEADRMQDDREDASLTLDQLRQKYKNLATYEYSEGDDNDVDEVLSDVNMSANEDGDEADEDNLEEEEEESEGGSDPEPSQEALRLYAETKGEGDDEEESELESDSGSSSGSGSESESESELSSEEEGPGLAALLGNFPEEEEDVEAEESSDDKRNNDEQKEHREEVSLEAMKVEANGDAGDVDPVDVDPVDSETKDGEVDDRSADRSADIVTPEEDTKDIDHLKTHSKHSTKGFLERLTPDLDDTKKEVEDTVGTAASSSSTEVENKHRIEPPFLLRGDLREYQRNGLDWLAGLVQSGTNGILADEMGLGKTIQTISLLAWLACEKQIWGPHLIVVPTSVMLNWEMEFKRFAPGFKILTYFGTPQQRKRKRRGWNKEDTWHVCITSYQLVIQDQVVFRGKRWQFMVLDEAHNIKNFRSQRWQALLNFNAQHRLLLTGTPLQNNLVELWSLLYFLMPSTRATQMMPAGFASLDDFQEWFAKPVDQMVEEGEEADEEARKTIAKLHQVLRPYLLRRLKVDVEKQMPGKYEHVVYCRLSKRQRYLYDDFMSRASTQATLESGNFMSILNCLMQLRKVCNHPDLFEVRPIVTSFTFDRGVCSGFADNVVPSFAVGPKTDLVDIDHRNLLFVNMEDESKSIALLRQELNANTFLEQELADLHKEVEKVGDVQPDFTTVAGWTKYNLHKRRLNRISIRQRMLNSNRLRTNRVPIYGQGLRRTLQIYKAPTLGVQSLLDREEAMRPVITRFAFVTPPVVILDYTEKMLGTALKLMIYNNHNEQFAAVRSQPLFHEAQVRLSIAFPDKRLLQYDCGKLQKLAILLRDLISNGHRVLIFTQMTKVLDILEQFLNLHGWRYLRLDGATRIEQRQALTERFNKDANIPVFILSTRSGGLGINLTGADTVIFYDSDWNPAMDRQCQDRCHRIGQTRDVHIYRLVSEFTIESNILRKATQKTVLDNVVIQEGDFTTEYFTRMSVQDILGNDAGRNTHAPTLEELEGTAPKQLEAAMAEAEDRDDQLAANLALSEERMDMEEFEEARQQGRAKAADAAAASATYDTESPQASTPAPSEPAIPVSSPGTSGYVTPSTIDPTPDTNAYSKLPSMEVENHPQEAEEIIGHIDDWMIRAIERGDIF